MSAWWSIDPATRSGLAVWEGPHLVGTLTVRPKGKAGRWTVAGLPHGERVWDSQASMWASLCTLYAPTHAVMELAYIGISPGAGLSVARRIGEIEGRLCQMGVPTLGTVTASSWRRVATEHGHSFPAGRDEAKARAQQIVRQLHSLEVPTDEADAVMVGQWWIWTGGLERAQHSEDA